MNTQTPFAAGAAAAATTAAGEAHFGNDADAEDAVLALADAELRHRVLRLRNRKTIPGYNDNFFSCIKNHSSFLC